MSFSPINNFNTTEGTRSNDPTISRITTDASNVERVNDLLAAYGPNAFKFDFSTATKSVGLGGYSLFAQAETWPALNQPDVSMGMVATVLGPCGLNTMHTHRGTEMQVNVGPGWIRSDFIENNNLQVISNVKEPGTVNFFPSGSIHMERNLNCTPTTFFSSFPNKDFGRIDMFDIVNFGPQILNATFNNLGTENLVVTGAAVGGIRRGIQECLTACNLPADYDFNKLYPNLGYFTPEWFNTTTLFSTLDLPPSPNAPSASGSAPPAKRHFRDFSVPSTETAVATQFLTLTENPLQPVVVGLSFTSGLLLLALLFSLLGFGRRRANYYFAPNMQEEPFKN